LKWLQHAGKEEEMSRNIRYISAWLCCLLIFSPMTEIWVKAEVSTASMESSEPTEPTEPVTDTTETETDQPEEEPGVCPEEDATTSSSDENQEKQQEEVLAGSESEPATPSEEKNCEEGNTDKQMDPIEQGITRIMSSPFSDVPTTYWAFSNILHLFELKVISGYENTDNTLSFLPNEKVTRAQAAKMIIEAIGEKQAVVTNQLFKDVPVNSWAAGYIQRAYELHIFKGYDDGRFGPNDTLKRSQMAKVIVEAYKFDYNGYTPSTPVFYDVNSKYWAYDYIEKMHYNGMSNGSNYRFLPEDLISRAQFSAFLSRAIEPGNRLKVTGPITTKGKVISKTALNIRSSASASSTILDKLTPGTMVNIIEIDGFWARVDHNGISGYVHKSYLKLYSPDSKYPLKNRIIVLDPGHGYKDPGTHYEGYKEKDIVLSVGKKVADRLRSAGAKVIMTRETDTFLELNERVEMAEDVYAELFVSLHVNSVKNNTSVKGTETYFNTSTNMNGAESKLLAYEIQKQMVEQADMYDRGIKDSGFYVIKNNHIPAVLLEMGFLPNKEDREKLVSDQYQEIIAESIYQGINNYYLK
jgi:N-acetylmuramoyl-L-alanine amidase